MKFTQLLKSSTEALNRLGVPDAGADAELLLLHVLRTDRLTAYRDNPGLSPGQEQETNACIGRRAAGEPVQYILGHIDFLGLTITVGRGVLIPRPETELLAEEAIKEVKSKMLKVKRDNNTATENLSALGGSLRLLDLCTGSGCLALALAREFPDAEVLATDISETALAYARKNVELNGIGNAAFFRGSLFGPLSPSQRFDLIVSNPPYIKREEIAELQREIREWEPREALDGGEDGLDFYRKIFAEAGSFLQPGGAVVLEIGFGQAVGIEEIARGNDFRDVVVIPDFAGIPRVLKAVKGASQSSHLQG